MYGKNSPSHRQWDGGRVGGLIGTKCHVQHGKASLGRAEVVLQTYEDATWPLKWAGKVENYGIMKGRFWMQSLPAEYNGAKRRSLRSSIGKTALNNPPTHLPNKLHLTFPSSFPLPCMSPWGPATPWQQVTRGLAASTPGRTQREQCKMSNMLAPLLCSLLF